MTDDGRTTGLLTNTYMCVRCKELHIKDEEVCEGADFSRVNVNWP